MKLAKVFALTLTAIFCMALTANAQLLGGTLKNSTSATSSLSGPRGGLNTGLNSTTDAAAGVQKGVNGSLNSTTDATAQAEHKKKTDKASPAKQTTTSAQSQVQSTTQAAAQAGTSTSSSTTQNAENSQTSAGKHSSKAEVWLFSAFCVVEDEVQP